MSSWVCGSDCYTILSDGNADLCTQDNRDRSRQEDCETDLVDGERIGMVLSGNIGLPLNYLFTRTALHCVSPMGLCGRPTLSDHFL